MRIGIIGAGLAGLTLATRLKAKHDVTVFEKARGPGGRMSTRRAEPYAFDHGAQYFTQRSEAFGTFLKPLREKGLVQAWPQQSDSRQVRYVAAPGMNAICKHLAEDLNLHAGLRIEGLSREDEEWRLTDTEGKSHGPFDWVVSTAPAPQTKVLFPDDFSGQSAISGVEMAGCFALMLGFEASLELDWQALRPEGSPIGWMAVNTSKPGRPESFALLIQSTNEWAERHLEDDPAEVKGMLLKEVSTLVGRDVSSASHQVLHRWRYAATPKPAGVPFLLDEVLNLAVCGDWCLGSKVEAAFESANALAQYFE